MGEVTGAEAVEEEVGGAEIFGRLGAVEVRRVGGTEEEEDKEELPFNDSRRGSEGGKEENDEVGVVTLRRGDCSVGEDEMVGMSAGSLTVNERVLRWGDGGVDGGFGRES